ncbi:hypothetical protein NFI96_017663, partial [Prochilodus magdalenae]
PKAFSTLIHSTMATGRGQFFVSLLQGLQQARPGASRDQKKKPAGSARAGRTPTGPPLQVLFINQQYLLKLSSLCRLPPEIILKIFSYLDADSLFSVTFVNRQFHNLANDNAIWYELYANEVARKKWRSRLAILPNSSTRVQDMPSGFWKRLIFREMGCPKDTSWKKELRHVNPNTGMPEQTQQLLGSLRVCWEITLTKKGGQEVIYKQNHNFFSDSSVTVSWNSGVWPCIHQVSTLQLHGVIRPFPSTATDKPQWRSLISKIEVCTVEKWRFIATDKLVKLIQFDEGITVGIWRGTWMIAFVMANLHFHKLVERSLLGSLSWYVQLSFSSYRSPEVSEYEDVDPDYDLRGYTMLIVLHNSVRRIMRRRYSPLLCSKDSIRHGFAQFKLTSEHTPVSGRISFPWMAEGLQGDIKLWEQKIYVIPPQNCCMMTVTVLDEGQKPLWCISSAVPLLLSTYNEEEFVLLHQDMKGKVRMNFVWMQDMQQYFLISLLVRVSVPKLNKLFSREFCRPQRR